MNKRIALIILYFGKIPEYAKLFFYSLKFNKDLDVLLFTDNYDIKETSNLKVYKLEFAQMKKRIQKNFDFEICLEQPYKLCDFKPAYGKIFAKELVNYEFWGHCDLDMILGNINSFLNNDILDSFDKIYQHGHLCIYRNYEENNLRFMSNVGMSYKEVFTTPIICVFDEVIGMQKKYDLMKIKTYKKRDCVDISPWHDHFVRAESYLSKKEKSFFNLKKQIFFWENGRIYRAAYYNGEIHYDEFNYLHFQKRNLDININLEDNPNAFYITRDGILPKVEGESITIQTIEKYNSLRLGKEMKRRFAFWKFIWIRRYKKYIKKKI